jgi:hypothetical protein
MGNSENSKLCTQAAHFTQIHKNPKDDLQGEEPDEHIIQGFTNGDSMGILHNKILISSSTGATAQG